MGENTKIEWADHTQNFWIGCEEVSPGCKNCYAAARAHRLGENFAQRRRTSHNNWRQPEKWNRAAEKLGIRFRVFTNSLADFFDKAVPIEWRADALVTMLALDNLDWLVLTKRIGNAHKMLDAAMAAAHSYGKKALKDAARYDPTLRESEPLPPTWAEAVSGGLAKHIWFGGTMVTQAEYDRDIEKLLQLPAAVRFVSFEPLLEPIDARWRINDGSWDVDPLSGKRENAFGDVVGREQGPKIDWVIVGGESGHHAREFHVEWAESLAKQCKATGTPMFMKQVGARPMMTGTVPGLGGKPPHQYTAPLQIDDRKGGDPLYWPSAIRVRQFPEVA